MQGAKAAVGGYRHVGAWGHHDPRDSGSRRRSRLGSASVAYLAVIASAVVALVAVGFVHPLSFRSGLAHALLEVGIVLAALLGARLIQVRFRAEAEVRRSVAEAAAAAERRRIARDLHDGLAQDLAFIAAHGDRLARELGDEHPLAVAARRALAVSRGAIADLSAVEASTAAGALREVAGELGTRFGIQIDVHAEPVAVTSSDREDIVRVAREAIVNAARHGRARNVTVSLTPEDGRIVLRVRDDGVGISPAAARDGGGFGFLSMRERAKALGGGLTASAPADGGTELELVVPS